jgi:hypothetical protein
MIHIQYTNGHYDYIKPADLDDKILSGEISRFKRSTGWVRVGKDQIRRFDYSKCFYFGPEKRRHQIN